MQMRWCAFSDQPLSAQPAHCRILQTNNHQPSNIHNRLTSVLSPSALWLGWEDECLYEPEHQERHQQPWHWEGPVTSKHQQHSMLRQVSD